MVLIIEYLGPQLVQFMNGYRYLKSLSSNSSRRQSLQVAMSAVTRDIGVPLASLWLDDKFPLILQSAPGSNAIHEVICAKGGDPGH